MGCEIVFTRQKCGLPRWLSGKESACNAGDAGDSSWIPGSGMSLGEGNGNPLQYSYLVNPTDRGACWATVHVVAKESDMTEQIQQHLVEVSNMR